MNQYRVRRREGDLRKMAGVQGTYCVVGSLSWLEKTNLPGSYDGNTATALRDKILSVPLEIRRFGKDYGFPCIAEDCDPS